MRQQRRGMHLGKLSITRNLKELISQGTGRSLGRSPKGSLAFISINAKRLPTATSPHFIPLRLVQHRIALGSLFQRISTHTIRSIHLSRVTRKANEQSRITRQSGYTEEKRMPGPF